MGLNIKLPILIKKTIALTLATILFFEFSATALAQALPTTTFQSQNYFNQQYQQHQQNNPGHFDTLNSAYQAAQLSALGLMPREQYQSAVSGEISKEIPDIAPEQLQELMDTLYALYTAAAQEEDAQVSQAYQKFAANGGRDAKWLFGEIYKKNFTLSDPEQEIAQESLNLPAYVWMRGALRHFLTEGARGQNREIMLASLGDINWIAQNFGPQPRDKAALLRYINYVQEGATDFCKADSKANWQTQKKFEDQCSALTGSFITLAALAANQADKARAAAKIYGLMKTLYKKDLGIMAIGNGAAALIVLDTREAYDNLEKFLLSDSVPAGKPGTLLWHALDLLSAEAYSEKAIGVVNNAKANGAGRYLNDFTVKLQSCDSAFATSAACSADATRIANLKTSAYGNALEDIGHMLATAGTDGAKNIADKILAQYLVVEALKDNCIQANQALSASCDSGYRMHLPLVAGILKEPLAAGNAGNAVAEKIYNADWWDLNEASQRRINNIAAAYLAKTPKTRDAAKQKRYQSNIMITDVFGTVDMALGAIFLPMLIASIPAMARGVRTIIVNIGRARRLGAIARPGLARAVQTQIRAAKAANANPQNVRAAVQARSQARHAAEANVRTAQRVEGAVSNSVTRSYTNLQRANQAVTNARGNMTVLMEKYPQITAELEGLAAAQQNANAAVRTANEALETLARTPSRSELTLTNASGQVERVSSSNAKLVKKYRSILNRSRSTINDFNRLRYRGLSPQTQGFLRQSEAFNAAQGGLRTARVDFAKSFIPQVKLPKISLPEFKLPKFLRMAEFAEPSFISAGGKDGNFARLMGRVKTYSAATAMLLNYNIAAMPTAASAADAAFLGGNLAKTELVVGNLSAAGASGARTATMAPRMMASASIPGELHSVNFLNQTFRLPAITAVDPKMLATYENMFVSGQLAAIPGISLSVLPRFTLKNPFARPAPVEAALAEQQTPAVPDFVTQWLKGKELQTTLTLAERGTAGVLSMGGLGALTEWTNNRQAVKKYFNELETLATQAAVQARANYIEDNGPAQDAEIFEAAAYKENYAKIFNDLLSQSTLPARIQHAVRKQIAAPAERGVTYTSVTVDGEPGAYSLAQKYNFIEASQHWGENKQPVGNTQAAARAFELKVKKHNLIANLFVNQKYVSRPALLWILASAADEAIKVKAYDKMNYKPQAAEVVSAYNSMVASVETSRLSATEKRAMELNIKRSVYKEESTPHLAAANELALSRPYDEFPSIDPDKISNAIYSEHDLAPLLDDIINGYRTTLFGNKVYTQLLPVYHRNQRAELSEEPSMFIALNGRKVAVPAGFVVAQDELGKLKYVHNSVRDIKNSPVPGWWIFSGRAHNPKWMLGSTGLGRYGLFGTKGIIGLSPFKTTSKSRHIFIETELNRSELVELSALVVKTNKHAALTPQDDDVISIINSGPKDKFNAMVRTVSMVAGADMGASLSSQLGKTLPWQSLTIALSGFGYIAPLVANIFKNAINKIGYYRTFKRGFLTMAGVSAAGMLAGMTGFFSPQSILAGVVPVAGVLLAAISVASIFSTGASNVLKSAYPDNTIFASQNMRFTTLKSFSRMVVSFAPWLLMKLISGDFLEGYYKVISSIPWMGSFIDSAPVLNWSVVVPVMFGLSLMGYFMLEKSRLKTEHKNSPAPAPTQEAKQKAAEAKAEAQQLFKTKFAKDFKSHASRLFNVYAAYAPINSVMIGLVAGIIMGGDALLVTGAGNALGLGVRMLADRLIRTRKFTEDQITGILLPVMGVALVGMLVFPIESALMLGAALLMYASTPTFGVSEQTRMQNAVAAYYRDLRLAVDKDTKLNARQKAEEKTRLKEEEKSMKLNASELYNKKNAWGGIVTIYGAAVLGWLLFGDLGLILGSESISTFSESLRNSISFLTGDINTVASGKEAVALIAPAVARLSVLVSLVFEALLMITNRGLIREAYRTVAPVKVTAEDLPKMDDPAYAAQKLRLGVDRMDSNKEAIIMEIDALFKITDISKGSRTSEDELFDIYKRLVKLNNRIKFFTTYHDGAQQLNGYLHHYKELVDNFRKTININEPSSKLKMLTAELVAASAKLSFDKQNNVINSQMSYLQEGSHIRPVMVRPYEDALMYKGEMDKIVREYKAGKIYDGLLNDFEYYYRRALSSIERYMEVNNLDVNRVPGSRVSRLKAEIEETYQSFSMTDKK